MLENGLYKVSFQTPKGLGYGVLALADGIAQGGDTTMFYRGTYNQDGDSFEAAIEIGTHTTLPGHGSVFGIPKASINLKGKSANGQANVQGSSPQAPGIPFSAHITHIK